MPKTGKPGSHGREALLLLPPTREANIMAIEEERNAEAHSQPAPMMALAFRREADRHNCHQSCLGEPMKLADLLPAFASATVDDLVRFDDANLDALDFGVIEFDAEGAVRRYNRLESQMAGLSPSQVLGRSLFAAVAPCMNNFMVAQRFADAAAEGTPVDATIDYVLTLRMRPAKVRLRLLADPRLKMRYVLVERRA